MCMTMKFVEMKLCKTCKENLNYKKFRKVNFLKKGPNKGNLLGGLISMVERDFRLAQCAKKTGFIRGIDIIQFLN